MNAETDVSPLPPGDSTERRRLVPMSEAQRMEVLRAHGVLDSLPEESFDELVVLAAEMLSAPMALINLIEEERTYVLSCVGPSRRPQRRQDGICPFCIGAESLVVRDASVDPRFRGHAVVTGAPHIRFYAGVTLVSREGAALGTLCVFSSTPRDFSPAELRRLKILGRQVEAQLELRRHAHEREVLLRLIVEQCADGIVVADAGGTLRIFNPAAQEQHGMPALEVPSSQWSSTYGLVAEDGSPLPPEAAPLYRALQGERVREGHVRVRRPDGSQRTLSTRATPLRQSDGRLAGALVITRDETERLAREVERARLLEETRAALRAREDFLVVAGHELNTPLTCLKLEVQRLTRQLGQDGEGKPGLPPPRVAQSMERTDRQLRRLSRLVTDLLYVSRLHGGRLPLERERTELRGWVTDVVERASAEFEQAGVSLCLVPGDSEEELVGQWDRFRLEQVVLNLLSNALKYGRGRPVRVQVGRRGQEAWLSVRDEGVGLREEDRTRIFERFERAIHYNEASGLGLGLFISRTIVEAHQGRIQVDSREGEGSTFTVSLPLES
jgi:PAS domain S-box-containing protein